MKKLGLVLLIAVMAVSFSVAAFAADAPGKYPAGPIQKAERGFNNALFGWTEIPKRIVDKTKESNPVKGFVLGIFQGTCRAIARTASGAADIVTFPFSGKGDYGKPAVLPDMPAAE